MLKYFDFDIDLIMLTFIILHKTNLALHFTIFQEHLNPTTFWL